MTADDTLTVAEVLDFCDGKVTYRQLEYWCRSGYLGEHHAQRPGSGRHRRFTFAEAHAIRYIGEVIRALTASGLNPDLSRIIPAARKRAGVGPHRQQRIHLERCTVILHSEEDE